MLRLIETVVHKRSGEVCILRSPTVVQKVSNNAEAIYLLRKCSESSENTGSESSFFIVTNKMSIQLSTHRPLSAAGTALLLSCLTLSVFAQQTNPNKLPPCPKPDHSKTNDVGHGGRTEKWTYCWGRYTVESHKDYKGDVLEGEWRGGLLHGQVTYYFLADNQYKGDTYVGEFKEGKKHGQGTYTHANGYKYVGEHKNDVRNGYGTYTSPNGDKYVGEFKDGKFSGQGIGTSADGRRFEGIWENDQFMREAKVNLPGQNVQSTRTTQDSNTSNTSANSFGVENAKVKCQELGFKTGTERYGKCVLELSR